MRIEREIVESLVKAGCRYIHIDAPGFTAYVDKPTMEQMRARGEDPMENFSRSLKAESKVVENLGDVATGIHLCRGNQRSMWHREGTYDAIAERLFNELAHDRFMLEYDTPRAGSFEPLRFVPKGKVVVLGLVSTKTSEMETVDGLKRRIDEAAKFVPLDQLAISPQCGFASDVVGNLISADDQKRKLELVVETARQVWGRCGARIGTFAGHAVRAPSARRASASACRSAAFSLASASFRCRHSSSAFATSAASSFCGMCCGQFTSQASIEKTRTCSGFAW